MFLFCDITAHFCPWRKLGTTDTTKYSLQIDKLCISEAKIDGVRKVSEMVKAYSIFECDEF